MGPRTRVATSTTAPRTRQPEHANNRIRHDLFNWEIMESEHVGSSTVDDRTRMSTTYSCILVSDTHPGSRLTLRVRSRSLKRRALGTQLSRVREADCHGRWPVRRDPNHRSDLAAHGVNALF